MERPRPFLATPTTTSQTYVPILNVTISNDAKGVSALDVGINPDPNALYSIIIGKIMSANELALLVIWDLHLAHIEKEWYQGLSQGDTIQILHRSPSGASITSGATIFLSEVVVGGDVAPPIPPIKPLRFG